MVSSGIIEPVDQTMVVAGNTAFAAALYGETARSPGNVFFAPASISIALAMTYAGARHETAAEMARALRLPALDPPRLHAAFGALAAAGDGAPGVELATAGALFGQRGYGFLPGFLALLAERYGAGLRQTDFVAATWAPLMAQKGGFKLVEGAVAAG
jgi:serpin B